MVFPADPLDATVELHLSGVWTDISDKVRTGADEISIARGIADEAGSADPATLSLTVDNAGGRFSPRNPLSPYFGQLGRNTPIRVSVDQGDRSLDLFGLSTSRASIPDDPGLELSFDVDWRIDLEPDAAGWRFAHLASKYEVDSSQRGWFIWLQEDGTLRLSWSQDGVALRTAISTASIDTTQRRLAIRVIQQGNNGAGGTNISFWTAPTIAGPFVQVGSTVVVGGGTATWFDSTAALELGAKVSTIDEHPRGFTGQIHGFELRTGIAASFLAVDADFSVPAEDTSVFADATGHTWTVASGARIAPSGVRFTGEVSNWPPKWSSAGQDAWAPIEAAGILRRLQQGATPIRSVLHRYITSSMPHLVAYWPCEEETNSTATTMASPLPGVRPMLIKGRPEFAAYSDVASSAPIPRLNDSVWVGSVPLHEGSGSFQVRFLVHIPDDTSTGNTQSICLIRTTNFLWHLAYMTDPVPGSLRLETFDNEGNGPLYSSGGIDFNVFDLSLLGDTRLFSLEFEQDGGNINVAIRTIPVGRVDGTDFFPTVTGTLGKGTQIVINNNGGIDDMSVGHVTYQSSITADASVATRDSDMGLGLDGYDREKAASRIIRLAEENALPVRIIGDPADTVSMGPQRVGTLVDLMRECAAADGGLLCDDREMLGVVYRTRASLYNRAPTLTLDHDAGEIDALELVDDDQFIRNDVTVSRTGGASARVELDSGPLSTTAPPLGAGRYDEDVTLNVASDSDTLHRAGWRLYLGTVDEARVPVVAVNLRDLAEDAVLVADAVEVDVGARIRVVNPPIWLPPEDVDQVVQGYTETLGNHRREIAYNCIPASPYNVAEMEAARYAPSASALDAGVTSSAAVLSVSTTSGPLWTTDPADTPIPIVVAGERMTVTAISGAVSPQTFTVVRSVNGIVKAHSAGAAVQLSQPSHRAL